MCDAYTVSNYREVPRYGSVLAYSPITSGYRPQGQIMPFPAAYQPVSQSQFQSLLNQTRGSVYQEKETTPYRQGPDMDVLYEDSIVAATADLYRKQGKTGNAIEQMMGNYARANEMAAAASLSNYASVLG